MPTSLLPFRAESGVGPAVEAGYRNLHGLGIGNAKVGVLTFKIACAIASTQNIGDDAGMR